MKLVLFLALSCLALHSGKGVPATSRYMLVKCNPTDSKANCVTHRGSEIAWTPDLPARLPASSAMHLETEPVEEERPEGGEEEMKPLEPQLANDEEESPSYDALYEHGSGLDEGSADEGPYVADSAFVPGESDTGSGESDMDLYKGEGTSSWTLADETKPQEEDLREDHLLQM